MTLTMTFGDMDRIMAAGTGEQVGISSWGGHEGHLPRRQRKAKARGGFILEEVSRGVEEPAGLGGSEQWPLISGHLSTS